MQRVQVKAQHLWPSFRSSLGANLHSQSVNLNSSSSSSSSCLQYRPWSGLKAWRQSPVNENRFWGSNGPQGLVESSSSSSSLSSIESASCLAELGALVLCTSDPLTKSRLSHLAYSKWSQQHLPIGVFEAPPRPARPPHPKLVSPKEIPAPKNSGLPLNAYMLHNLAHVELNAIDLAWDTVVRFSPFSEVLGEGFFADFAHVADDESRHFTWCSQRLAELGFKYGDMAAHNLLWRECAKSSDNVAARLATIPLVQKGWSRTLQDEETNRFCSIVLGEYQALLEEQKIEARGLDAGPRLVKKLIGFGDHRTSDIVAKIADEEVAHVAVGVDWFILVCRKMERVPCSTFKGLLKEYNVELKGPFNYSARDEAGLPRDWYDILNTNEQDETSGGAKNEQLSTVYDRLASVISMETKNSSLHGTPE